MSGKNPINEVKQAMSRSLVDALAGAILDWQQRHQDQPHEDRCGCIASNLGSLAGTYASAAEDELWAPTLSVALSGLLTTAGVPESEWVTVVSRLREGLCLACGEDHDEDDEDGGGGGEELEPEDEPAERPSLHPPALNVH